MHQLFTRLNKPSRFCLSVLCESSTSDTDRRLFDEALFFSFDKDVSHVCTFTTSKWFAKHNLHCVTACRSLAVERILLAKSNIQIQAAEENCRLGTTGWLMRLGLM